MAAWDVEALDWVRIHLDAAVAERQIPGAVAAVGDANGIAWQVAVGYAEAAPYSVRPMTLDTIFDLASVSKVTATLPLVLGLVQEGSVLLSDPVSRFLPEFAGGAKDRVTIRHLLTHTGGLRWHEEFFRTLRGGEVLEAAMARPLVYEPGGHVVYSDLGFMMLGEIVARVTGLPLAQAAHSRVFAPLGMVDTGYLPAGSLAHRIAATEALPGRDGPKVGIVHDDNTEAMGGVAGHAGVFGTAADLGRYAAMWLGSGPPLLGARVRALAIQPATPPPWHRGLGWVRRGDAMAHTGDLWPERTFGHTGYTGTSIAIDPDAERWAVLLTNRVHFGRAVDISRLRRAVHNAVAGAWR